MCRTVFRIADHVRTDIGDGPCWTMPSSGPSLLQNGMSASRRSNRRRPFLIESVGRSRGLQIQKPSVQSNLRNATSGSRPTKSWRARRIRNTGVERKQFPSTPLVANSRGKGCLDRRTRLRLWLYINTYVDSYPALGAQMRCPQFLRTLRRLRDAG